MENPTSSSPHILMFPLPVQSHVNAMLKLAELFCLANFKVTFLNSAHNHQRMAQFSDIQAHFSRYLGFKFAVIPDGLPSDHPRVGGDWIDELFQGLTSTTGPILREMLFRTGPWAQMERVTCMVIDAALSFGYDVGNEAEVPVIGCRLISACCIWAYSCIPKLIQGGEMPFDVEADEARVPVIEFKATSACHLWAHFCVPKLLESGEIPITGHEDMDELVQNIPGMTGFLRRRDLPGFCRVTDVAYPELQFMANEQKRKAHPIILNTFEDLEGPILSHLQAHYPTIYSVGPLQAHLKHRLASEEATLCNHSSSSFWEVDRSCISWLDHKPNKSVVYVSFGSLTRLTKDQFMELWAGLVQTNKFFLWIMRSNMIIGSDSDWPNLNKILEETKGRGYVVSWAPQEEVLDHRAVGGFLTHSGWNSTLEGIEAGVPMLCWPYFYDQLVNSRYVSEVWRIGLDMKDTCDRNIVEKMVNDLMDGKRDELQRSMVKMSHLVRKSVSEGGSSYANLHNLIEDIKMMSDNLVQ